MKKNQQVAAYVEIPNEDRAQWFLGKIEKKQANGKYVIHDEYAEDPSLERFIVDPQFISLFPNTQGPYSVGEHILARWKLTDGWTTELYDAEIIKVIKKDTLVLKYQESELEIETNVNKVTKYPAGFLSKEEEAVNEEEEANDEEAKAESETQHEATAESPKSPSKNLTQEQTSEEHSDTNQPASNAPTTSAEVTEDTGMASTPVPSSPPASPPVVEEVPQGPKFMPRMAQEIPNRKLNLRFNPAETQDPTDLHILTDDEFIKLLPELRKPERIEIKQGTPLLDCLTDPELFEQESVHTTSSGMLFRKGMKQQKFKSALMNGEKCGRLGMIFNEYRN